MTRIQLLAAASVLVLSSVAAMAVSPPTRSFSGRYHPFRMPKGAGILYNQNSNATGVGVDSQNFTSGTFVSYNDQGADDFVVPEKTLWTIAEVDVSGVYYNGSGPAGSENVIFYRNGNGEPGNAVKHGTFNELRGRDDNGNFAIKLPGHGLRLRPGIYWVSVVANCKYDGCGEWGWETTSVQHGSPAMWRNPDNFCCCPVWETLESCISDSIGPDFMFDLRGTAKRK